MITACINTHVGHRRHMAGCALRAGPARQMMVVGRGFETRRQMALRADRIAFGAQPQAVRIVAVITDHAGTLHAALGEGPPFEDLALDLPVSMVEPALE